MARKIVWMIISALCISLLSTSLSTAQEGAWVENFDDPGLPGWEHSPGTAVVDGVLRLEPENFAAHGGDWTDFTLLVSLRLDGPGDLVLSYRSDNDGTYLLVFTEFRFDLMRESRDRMVLLSSTPEPISRGVFHELQINVSAGIHTVMIDGAQVISGSDPDTPVRAGGIALETIGEIVAEVESITLTPSLMTQPPIVPEQPATPISSPISVGEPGLWVRTGGPPGGIGYDIRYNFANPDIWYVTDNFSGVHISTDNGQTWQQSNTGIPAQVGPTGDWRPIFSLTVDPLNAQIVWAGTDQTGHIYKSIDGGLSWVEKDEGITIEYDALTFRGFTVDPRSSDIVYAMAEVTSNSPIPDTVGGAVYKTSNGGESWQKIWDGGMPSSLARYLWVDSHDPDVLYVSTGIFDRRAVGSDDPLGDPFGGLGVLKSTDGGQTWRIFNEANGFQMLYVGSLYMHPENPDVLLAAVGHLVNTPQVEIWMQEGYSPSGIYRTTNGGETWTQVLMPPRKRSGEVFASVDICPSDSNIVYAGSAEAMYRSDDGGQTWTLTAGGNWSGWGPPGVVTGWPIDMQCDPRDPNRVFANNYLGGNFVSEDGGYTWANASIGYTGSQMVMVAFDPFNPNRLYAAGRSGLWRSDDDGMTWQGLYFPPPDQLVDFPYAGIEYMAVAVDPQQPDHVLSGTDGLIESTDGGDSWQFRWSLGENALALGIEDPGSISVIQFAPSDPKIVYAGVASRDAVAGHEPVWLGLGVVISRDGGTSWQLSPDPQLHNVGILDLAVDPTSAQLVYAATMAGLFQSTDGGNSWSPVGGLPEGASVHAVTLDPLNSSRVLVAVKGLGVYISADGGHTWQPAVAGLEPNGQLSDIVFDPANPSIVYASDHASGVYRSTDGGISWAKNNDGLANRAALRLAISADGQQLYLATDGAGVYRLNLSN